MTFRDAVLRCLTNYTRLSGRASRQEFWHFILFGILVWCASGFLAFSARTSAGLVFLALFTPTVSVGVRRLHDHELRGWWLVLPAGVGAIAVLLLKLVTDISFGLDSIALVAGISPLVLMLLPGTPGPNRFGMKAATQVKDPMEELFVPH